MGTAPPTGCHLLLLPGPGDALFRRLIELRESLLDRNRLGKPSGRLKHRPLRLVRAARNGLRTSQ